MKSHFAAIAVLLILISGTGSAKKAELYASKYFIFKSNLKLNAHLFLYNKASAFKSFKGNTDSLAAYAFKDKLAGLSANDLRALNKIIIFYKDSLLAKDLLMDSLMRNYTDYLSTGGSSKMKLKSPWQLFAFENMKLFEPYFTKLYWPAIDSANKTWVSEHKGQITAMETEVISELERIYQVNLPGEKLYVDLVPYATWAGAYSYNDSFYHIILSSASKTNQGDLGTEVIFHETSHFLVDKLSAQIRLATKTRHAKIDLSLWHNMIFYTTGFVLEKYYKLKWQKFEPYYVQMKFSEKFLGFKKSVDACVLYWDPYINGQVNFETAVNGLVTYMIEK